MTSVAATARVPHAHHDDRSFIRKYIFSTDHKIIGIQFLFASLFVPEGAIRSGWTNYAPLSARPDLSGVTTGQILWCVSIVVLGLSSVMGSVNYITTIINHRAPGMTWFRMPLSVWALFITA